MIILCLFFILSVYLFAICKSGGKSGIYSGICTQKIGGSLVLSNKESWP
jgi:hypothetical protein